jgi:hypothetical protein
MELLLYPWESYLERYILQIPYRKPVAPSKLTDLLDAAGDEASNALFSNVGLFSTTVFLFELFRANFWVTKQEREAVSQTQYISGFCT